MVIWKPGREGSEEGTPAHISLLDFQPSRAGRKLISVVQAALANEATWIPQVEDLNRRASALKLTGVRSRQSLNPSHSRAWDQSLPSGSKSEEGQDQ